MPPTWTIAPLVTNGQFQEIMHWALSLKEVQSAITAAFDTNCPWVGEGHTSLAALARVNHSFSESALKELWRGLPSLIPLLEVFPSDVWYIRENKLVRPGCISYTITIVTAPTIVFSTPSLARRVGAVPLLCATRQVPPD